jgi:general transcription factor 3C polypeptide 6
MIVSSLNLRAKLGSVADGTPVVHEETGPSEANLFSGKCIMDPNQTPSKNVKPVAQLHKILKFRLAPDTDIQIATAEQQAK